MVYDNDYDHFNFDKKVIVIVNGHNLEIICKMIKTNNISDSKRQQTTTVDNKCLINGFVLTDGFSLRLGKLLLITMDAQDNKTIEVPLGITKENVEKRKQIILDFYRKWKQENPTQRKYNVSLKDFVNIRNVSITRRFK